LAKYSIAIDSPAADGRARTRPALISGKVAPSRIDCGRISAQDSSSFAPSARVSLPSAGSSAP
jgi:hypothetical protein